MRRLGQSGNGCSWYRAERPNHFWSWDFLYERTEDGRPLKLLTVVDEFLGGPWPSKWPGASTTGTSSTR